MRGGILHDDFNGVQRAVGLVSSTNNTGAIGTDERRERMRQLANVCIEMFLEYRDRIAESPALLAEAA